MPDASVLTNAQHNALHVLGYLFLRMGQYMRAKKLFAALVALYPNDMLAHRCLAATYIGLKNGEKALEHIEKACTNTHLATKDAALFLLKAQALWLCGRSDEARNALNTYITTSGECS